MLRRFQIFLSILQNGNQDVFEGEVKLFSLDGDHFYYALKDRTAFGLVKLAYGANFAC